MAGTSFHNIKISGLAGAVPVQIQDNFEYSYKFGMEEVERFIALTGVRRFRKAKREQTSGDLGYVAAERLLEEFCIERSQIGLLIDVTQSPDYVWPSTAYVLHKRLRLSKECMAFDVNLGCSGFVYGIHMCASMLQSMKQKYALLVTGDVHKYLDFLSREKPDTSNVMMFGDSGTALLLERSEEASLLRTEMYGDGENFQILLRGGQCRSADVPKEPVRCSDGIDRSILDPYMDGMGVFAFSTREAPTAVLDFLEEGNEKIEDYETFYFHQANKMIIERIAKKLHIDASKTPMSLGEYGNTSSASIPITMIDQLGENKSTVLQKVLLCGFGVGLSWGVVSMEIMPCCVLPMIETEDYYKEGEIKVL